MATDWRVLEEEMKGGFKDYAEDGVYKVKCDSIEVKEVGKNGSIIMKFGFEEGDVKYPTADHWLSFKNEKWRKWHNRCLMVVLGASAENAEKTVDVCEGKGDKDSIVKAYESTYKKLLAKKPEVEIEVFTEGKYARAEFTDRSVAMPHDDKETKASTDEIPADTEEGEEDLSALPF